MALVLSLLLLLMISSGMIAQERPAFEVPAILLTTGILYSNESHYQVNNTEGVHYFALTCGAYGSPLPRVEWSTTSDDEEYLPIEDSEEQFIIQSTEISVEIDTINSREIENHKGSVSTLFVCDPSDQFLAFQCTAVNNVPLVNSIGYQIARFDYMNQGINIEVFKAEVEAGPPNQETETSATVITILLVVGLFISVIVITCVALVLHKRKRKVAARSSRQTSSNARPLSVSHQQHNETERNRPTRHMSFPNQVVISSTTNSRTTAGGRYSVLQHHTPKKPADASYSSLRLNWSGTYESTPTSSLSSRTETPYQYYEDIDEIRQSSVTRLQALKDSKSRAETGGPPQLDQQGSMVYCNAYQLSESSSQPDACRLEADEELCPLPPLLRINPNTPTARYIKSAPTDSESNVSQLDISKGD